MNNLFENIPKNLDKEVFQQLVNNEQVSIERIISKGHSSPESGWYDQDKNEWVMVVSGKAILSFDDGSDISLKTGDYVNIPAHKKHKVKWTDPAVETIWLAIFY
jgi:cupin 2 domain-containing protein